MQRTTEHCLWSRRRVLEAMGAWGVLLCGAPERRLGATTWGVATFFKLDGSVAILQCELGLEPPTDV